MNFSHNGKRHDRRLHLTYDVWGHLSTRAQGAYATTYEYRFGDKLRRVASTFPGDAPKTRFVYDSFGHCCAMGDVNTTQ